MFSHEGVWDQVQEDVRQQTSGLRMLSARMYVQWYIYVSRTAKAVMVFNVLVLICAGMNARMRLGTL
jgi:hypothetical protein